jgi:hypothetical protein
VQLLVADASLLTMFDEVRGKTLRLVQVEPRQALWTPPGTSNLILWHAGHALCVVERLTLTALEGRDDEPPALPPGWWDLFGWDSTPATTPAAAWPELAAVVEQLREQHARLGRTFAEITPQTLDEPLDLPDYPWHGYSKRFILLHGIHDEACHGGEIWLLRKLYERREPAA